jgi:hypothetical protein
MPIASAKFHAASPDWWAEVLVLHERLWPLPRAEQRDVCGNDIGIVF